MSSRASMTTRANTANAKSKPWPAKQRPWGTRWWRWAHPRCRASTPSPHRPPELGQHDTAGPSPVGGKGGVSLLLGRAPAGSPQTTANDSRSPRRRPTLIAVVPWEGVWGTDSPNMTETFLLKPRRLRRGSLLLAHPPPSGFFNEPGRGGVIDIRNRD